MKRRISHEDNKKFPQWLHVKGFDTSALLGVANV